MLIITNQYYRYHLLELLIAISFKFTHTNTPRHMYIWHIHTSLATLCQPLLKTMYTIRYKQNTHKSVILSLVIDL